MTTRWWAPEGPHIGPDEQDFQLLIPVDDARHDLGAALLALHRVGAAACEEVATSAIPDEVSLVQALATARAAFAAPLVESVSKSVGEGPYAGLLVRDVIDDAESGALLVFRTLVSSGVPGPVAAQRAGLVYGVPEDELSSYLQIAKELRAHPAALNDAADRALFTAVEKIATEEFETKEPEWEPVSKAPDDPVPVTRARRQIRRAVVPREDESEAREVVERPREVVARDDPETPYYDARDTAGRFARGSVAGPPEVGAAPTRKVRQQRKTRATRQTRQVRQEREKTRTRAVPGRTRTREKTRARGRDKARLRRSREEYTASEKANIADLPPADFTTGDYMQPIDNPSTTGPFDTLHFEVASALSRDEWRKFIPNLRRDAHGRAQFRMGYLAQERDLNHFGRHSDYATDEHRKKLSSLAADDLAMIEEAMPGVELHEPVAVTIDDDTLAALDPAQVPDYVKAVKRDALEEHFHEVGADPQHPEIQQQIEDIIRTRMKSNRALDDSGEVFVYYPRLTGQQAMAKPQVVELIFDAGVRGRDDGTGRNTDFRFDPNQIMQIENYGQPEVLYDPKIGAVRLRYHVSALYSDDDDSGFTKADDPDTDYWDNRDAGGRFAVGTRGKLVPREVVQRPREVVEREETVKAPATRATRQTRQTRQQRKERPKIIAKPVRERVKSRDKSRSRERMKQIKRQVESVAGQERKQKQGVREIRATGVYRVFTQDEFDKLVDEHGYTTDANISFPDPTSHRQVMIGSQDGRHADFFMRELTDGNIMEMDDEHGIAGAYVTLPSKRKFDPESEDYAHQIYDEIDTLFSQHEDIQQILVHYTLEGEVQFLGNKYAAKPVVLIEQDEEFDPAGPWHLRYDDTLTNDQMTADFDDPIVSMRRMMDSLHYDSQDAREDKLLPIKETRPTIHLYRLENTPATDEYE